MAMNGLAILKLLPQTNCKDCGFPTCLAFAMRLAGKKAEPTQCPHLSDEAKAVLMEASVPPMRKITISGPESTVTIGEELVMFRHEKKFFHAPLCAVCLRDTLSPKDLATRLSRIQSAVFERAGETLRLNGVALKCESGDGAQFARLVKTVRSQTGVPAVLMADSAELMKAGLEALPGEAPLLYRATAATIEKMSELAAQHSCPLVVSAAGHTELAELTPRAGGHDQMVLEPDWDSPREMVENLTILRRLALEKQIRELGFPSLVSFAGRETFPLAAVAMSKYASVLILDDDDPARIFPLLTLGQNIYTDPQKPLQVDPGLYRIGEPDRSSPVYITTNFSLTYFVVSTEIDGSPAPGWLLVADAEGQSVLTAWSAGKFTADSIAKLVLESGIENEIDHKCVVLPGYVAVLSGEVEEKLPGWKVMVGPPEASELSSFIKEIWQTR